MKPDHPATDTAEPLADYTPVALPPPPRRLDGGAPAHLSHHAR